MFFYLPKTVIFLCADSLPHFILAQYRVKQVSQVSRGLRGQQGFQESMEMRDHQDSQDPAGTQGLRYSNLATLVYWGNITD